jgi:Family of unknown function (DUF6370)
MRNKLSMLAIAVLFSSLTVAVAFADDAVKTITGEGQCAKCSLKKSDKCVNAVVVEEDGKKVTYLMDMTNKIAKDFHGKVCQDKLKIKVTGKVKEEDDKKIITPTEEIEIVKN